MRRAIAIIALASVACYSTEYSDTMQEPGRVEQAMYFPGGTATGTGVSMTDGSVVVTSADIADRYAIVFSCPHGKFALKPEGENAKRMFAHLKQGDSVTITYREVTHVRDGKRELYKLDFISALPR